MSYLQNYLEFPHGGLAPDQKGQDGVLDFSANINPLGPPKGVDRILTSVDVARYPDPFYTELRQSIATAEGVPAEHVLPGNGAAELIWRTALGLHPKRALLVEPTFSEYRAALEAVGCQVEAFTVGPENGFYVSEDLLDAAEEGYDLLVLCSPNNPTGLSVDVVLLTELINTCKDRGTVVFWDASFLDFVEDAGRYQRLITHGVTTYENLLVLKSFTKLYAIPGLRLGFLMGASGKLLEAVSKGGSPWSVSSLAAAVGVYVLKDADFLADTRKFFFSETEYVENRLLELGFAAGGVVPLPKRFFVPTETNFLLLHTELDTLKLELLEHRMNVRDCDNFRGLPKGFVRVAVKTREENDALLRALQEVLADAEG